MTRYSPQIMGDLNTSMVTDFSSDLAGSSPHITAFTELQVRTIKTFSPCFEPDRSRFYRLE